MPDTLLLESAKFSIRRKKGLFTLIYEPIAKVLFTLFLLTDIEAI